MMAWVRVMAVEVGQFWIYHLQPRGFPEMDVGCEEGGGKYDTKDLGCGNYQSVVTVINCIN